MTRVIVITSGKGGVGKTTTTSNIGMILGSLGHKTVLIDADVGLRNLDLLLGLENRIIYTGSDFLTDNCRLEQAVIKDKRQPNLSFLPLSSNRLNSNLNNEQVTVLIDTLKKEYEFILIDCPAGIDDGFKTAIECADEAIIVVTPEVPSIRDADRVIGLLKVKGIEAPKLVINRVRRKMVETEDMLSTDDILSILGIDLLGVIPDSEKIIIASNRGEPIVFGDKKCLPSLAFENTTQRLLGKNVDILDFDEISNKNPVKRLIKNIRKRNSEKE
jgi:septum site-determining protein MinD